MLVEQVEACFQLMEIRAALGQHFVGFNTGRWDYINSVSDAMAWDPDFINPNIDAITMTYGYMRDLRGSRAPRRATRPTRTASSRSGRAAWSRTFRSAPRPASPAGMKRAVAGAEREQREGASGKWVAHWKMVHIVRPVWEKVGEANQLGRSFPPLTYTRGRRRRPDAARARAANRPRRARSAERRAAVRQRLRQGLQAAALKPADFFGNDDVLYLMEDMATGEIRLSILWEWLHKGATLTAADAETGVKAGDTFTPELFARLLARSTTSC